MASYMTTAPATETLSEETCAGHGDAQEVVAGLLDQVVQAGALAAEDEDAVGAEVEVGVVGRAALVEAEHPDVGLLHLLERADEVGDAGDADVLGGAGGGLGDGGGDGRGAALGQDDAVDARAVGGAEERAEVVGVFDAVEGEEEAVVRGRSRRGGFRCQQVFDGRGRRARGPGRGLPGGRRCGPRRVSWSRGSSETRTPAARQSWASRPAGHRSRSRARMTESSRRAPDRTASSTGCRP